MTIAYNLNFPTNKDSLGSTRSLFFTNTQSVSDIFRVNHYTFGDAGGAGFDGNHKFVIYQRQTNNLPTTVGNQIATFGAIDSLALTQIWFQPSGQASGAGSIQLTAGDVTDNFFAANKAYNNTSPSTGEGGWTFLPGALLLNYGQADTGTTIPAAGAKTIFFPMQFSDVPYSIVVTTRSENSANNPVAATQAWTKKSFDINLGGGVSWGTSTHFNFIAIGPA